uniref:Ovule protein n=1 Tax=Brugia timori TaxID=42155 RepID=A0A0R3QTM2_9BILA
LNVRRGDIASQITLQSNHFAAVIDVKVIRTILHRRFQQLVPYTIHHNANTASNQLILFKFVTFWKS